MTIEQALTYLSQLNDNRAKEVINIIEDLQNETENLNKENNYLLSEKLLMLNDKLYSLIGKNDLFEENELLHKEIEQLKTNQLIKCDECKHCKIKTRVGNGISEPPYINNLRCNLFSLEPMQADDYCSYAERKEVKGDE